MSEWQPISTAPKDGTRVLLSAHDWREPVIGSFRPDTGPWYHGDEETDLPYGECKPTHWMPLPAPPNPAP